MSAVFLSLEKNFTPSLYEVYSNPQSNVTQLTGCMCTQCTVQINHTDRLYMYTLCNTCDPLTSAFCLHCAARDTHWQYIHICTYWAVHLTYADRYIIALCTCNTKCNTLTSCVDKNFKLLQWSIFPISHYLFYLVHYALHSCVLAILIVARLSALVCLPQLLLVI